MTNKVSHIIAAKFSHPSSQPRSQAAKPTKPWERGCLQVTLSELVYLF